METGSALAHRAEVDHGDRFPFGENWRRFLSVLDDRRIEQATSALRGLLRVETLAGRSFLDVGSGSGLSSLAAMRLGAGRVHTFDYDPQSVACTDELRRRYAPGAAWTVEQGNVLDEGYLRGLGRFDVVYSWGVLHHTGRLWRALENVVDLIADGGLLAVAIYNDQGGLSRRWTAIKRAYNRLPRPLRPAFASLVLGPIELKRALSAAIRLQPGEYIRSWTEYRERGMSRWHDLIDWVGGLPFEVAKPEEVFDFYRERGLELAGLKTCAGARGCNEFLFIKPAR